MVEEAKSIKPTSTAFSAATEEMLLAASNAAQTQPGPAFGVLQFLQVIKAAGSGTWIQTEN